LNKTRSEGANPTKTALSFNSVEYDPEATAGRRVTAIADRPDACAIKV